MGSTFAPSSANLYMDIFEQTHILNAQSNPFYDHIFCYYRYIDDIFCIYPDSDSYPAFQSWLNQLHQTIKFTFAGDKVQVNFLDTSVFRTMRNTLAVKPFRKAIDRNSYLHYSSFHPKPLRNSIPYGQFTRLKRNSSYRKDYVTQANVMKNDFIQRGYPKSLVQDAANRANRVERSELPQYKQKEKEEAKGITAALDFTPLASKIKSIVRQHWHIVADLPGYGSPPRWGLRRTKTLKDVLVSSDIRVCQERVPATVGHHRCGFCSCCAQAWETKEIVIQSKNFRKPLNFFSSCSTKMCIYLVMYICGLCYVGSTRSRLKVRITEHKSRIRNKTADAPMVQHFVSTGHHPGDFKFAVLEIVTAIPDKGGDIHKKLVQQENFWIFKLNTLHLAGLNTHMDLTVFL